jgi:hypothetical protein
MALYVSDIFNFLTQVNLQFPDEMSADELAAYRSKMETFRQVKGA